MLFAGPYCLVLVMLCSSVHVSPCCLVLAVLCAVVHLLAPVALWCVRYELLCACWPAMLSAGVLHNVVHLLAHAAWSWLCCVLLCMLLLAHAAYSAGCVVCCYVLLCACWPMLLTVLAVLCVAVCLLAHAA